MNQSVIVFASAASRSSTLPTPTEGMITYLEDTNALETYDGSNWVNVNDNTNAILKSTVTTAGDLIVANGNASVTRLGIGASQGLLYVNGSTPGWLAKGTTDQVLSTNSSGNLEWVTAGSAGAVLISSTTLSGTSVALTSIPQTYQDLKVLITGGTISTARNIRMSINGGANQSITGTAGSSSFDVQLDAPWYSSANGFKRITGWYDNDAQTPTITTSRNIQSTSGITSLTFTLDGSGNFTGGTLDLWGVK